MSDNVDVWTAHCDAIRCLIKHAQVVSLLFGTKNCTLHNRARCVARLSYCEMRNAVLNADDTSLRFRATMRALLYKKKWRRSKMSAERTVKGQEKESSQVSKRMRNDNNEWKKAAKIKEGNQTVLQKVLKRASLMSN